MVNAGRILIIPKGNWDNLASYQMLDLITYDGIAYLAKQASTGINPKTDPNKDTYWQTFGTAVVPDGETIIYDTNNDIAVNIDGTTIQYDSGTNFVKVAIDGVTLKYDSPNGYIYANVSSSLAGLTDVQLTNIQNGQIIAYNSVTSKFVNMNLPTGGGSKIKVTTSESTLYGKTVTLSDGTTTLTGTFSGAGEYTFEGVGFTGNLTISSSDGVDTATKVLNVPYYGYYELNLTFFAATINVTYPASAGATCTASDGVTTLVASGSPEAFIVPNAATWIVTVTLDGVQKMSSVNITSDGETKSVAIQYGTINLTYDNDFRGVTVTCVQGGTTISKTAPSGTNAMVFYPPTTGQWTISGSVGGTPYSTTATITSLSTAESATLQTLAQITATIYSATEDTVTFTDATGVSHTEVFASGQSSKSITFKILPAGSSITFTSSVAKDPNNLTDDYSKTVTITGNTTDIYLMPNNALYWYGYNGGMEDCTSANGWAYSGGISLSAPTHNTNSVKCQGIGSTVSAFASAQTYLQKTVHYILTANSTGRYFFSTIKDAANGFNTFGTYTLPTHISKTSNANTYIGVEGYYNGEGLVELYALWYE